MKVDTPVYLDFDIYVDQLGRILLEINFQLQTMIVTSCSELLSSLYELDHIIKQSLLHFSIQHQISDFIKYILRTFSALMKVDTPVYLDIDIHVNQLVRILLEINFQLQTMIVTAYF
jgi:hypothetical protein